MMKQRKEKKSETLEVRLPHSTKRDFMDACEREGITASQAVRTFIDVYVRRSKRANLKTISQDLAMKLIKNPLKTIGISASALFAALAFSAAPSMADNDSFATLDKDGDGYITKEDKPAGAIILEHLGEIDTNGDGKISEAEFTEGTKGDKIKVKAVTIDGDHEGVFLSGDEEIEALIEETMGEGLKGEKIVIKKVCKGEEDKCAETIDLEGLDGDFDWESEDGKKKVKIKRVIKETVVEKKTEE
ncbi:MAG: EF-hand domain-containing protein [Pseudomonadota bacterium]